MKKQPRLEEARVEISGIERRTEGLLWAQAVHHAIKQLTQTEGLQTACWEIAPGRMVFTTKARNA